MRISKDIGRFVVICDDPISFALQKISDNQSGIVYCVTSEGILEGSFTDGDFRRWIALQDSIDLSLATLNAANRTYVSSLESATPEVLDALISKQSLKSLPLVDDKGRLTAIAWPAKGVVEIAGRRIEKGQPAFLIAEIGNNHNGDLDRALALVEAAAQAGADCAKFQMRNLSDLYANAGDPEDASEDLGSQYTLDLLARFSLSNDDLLRAMDKAVELGLAPLCTPWDEESYRVLKDWGADGFKISSADLTNHDLIRTIARDGNGLILSTGMSSQNEIAETAKVLDQVSASYLFLHCNSTYPTPHKDINLANMPKLGDYADGLFGYSGHERGIAVPVAAVACGAKVVEKHFTFDKSMEGNDHRVSLLPEEFADMVRDIRVVEEAMGTVGPRQITQGERLNRETLAKSLVAATDIAAGELISEDKINVRSPGRGLQPNKIHELLGKPARRARKKGDFFFDEDLGTARTTPRQYHFQRSWGIPVRYHDFAALTQHVTPELVEFHFSYRDLDVDPARFLKNQYPFELVVHAPELFEGDHILDLASRDASYRERSIAEMQRVIDVTRSLTPYFPKTKQPLIIVNVGGFSEDLPIPIDARSALYDTVADSFSRLDQNGVELIVQTMPPFPWHFGGQRHHNLFVDDEEIATFCNKYDYRICFDISHSKLAANHLHRSFRTFTQNIAEYTAHLHIVDAKGLDDEGLQISDGEIDFGALNDDLYNRCPGAGFIPEIWQGHKNEGEGFWVALERLEKLFARKQAA